MKKVASLPHPVYSFIVFDILALIYDLLFRLVMKYVNVFTCLVMCYIPLLLQNVWHWKIEIKYFVLNKLLKNKFYNLKFVGFSYLFSFRVKEVHCNVKDAGI
jgi:hypothetical protein